MSKLKEVITTGKLRAAEALNERPSEIDEDLGLIMLQLPEDDELVALYFYKKNLITADEYRRALGVN